MTDRASFRASTTIICFVTIVAYSQAAALPQATTPSRLSRTSSRQYASPLRQWWGRTPIRSVRGDFQAARRDHRQSAVHDAKAGADPSDGCHRSCETCARLPGGKMTLHCMSAALRGRAGAWSRGRTDRQRTANTQTLMKVDTCLIASR